jgi:hypothetical protein
MSRNTAILLKVAYARERHRRGSPSTSFLAHQVSPRSLERDNGRDVICNLKFDKGIVVHLVGKINLKPVVSQRKHPCAGVLNVIDSNGAGFIMGSRYETGQREYQK